MKTVKNLLSLALTEDAEALFQIGKKAFLEGRTGFAELFLTFAELNHHSEATAYLAMVKPSRYDSRISPL